jgi:hypothetical protein
MPRRRNFDWGGSGSRQNLGKTKDGLDLGQNKNQKRMLWLLGRVWLLMTGALVAPERRKRIALQKSTEYLFRSGAPFHSMRQRSAPVSTAWPSLTLICFTVPAWEARISFSIFIASMTRRDCPFSTVPPGWTWMRRILPGI